MKRAWWKNLMRQNTATIFSMEISTPGRNVCICFGLCMMKEKDMTQIGTLTKPAAAMVTSKQSSSSFNYLFKLKTYTLALNLATRLGLGAGGLKTL